MKTPKTSDQNRETQSLATRFTQSIGSVIVLSAAGLSACSPISAALLPGATNAKDALTGDINYTVPQCEVMRPDYQLNLQAVSFEMVDKAGISLGFGIPAGINFGVNFSLQKAQLTLSMDAVDPLDTNDVLGAATIQSNKISLSAAVDISFAMIKLSPSYAYNTPIATMTRGAMNNGLTALFNEMKNESPWSAHVLAVVPPVPGGNPEQIVINSGSNAGIQAGDQFAVYNVTDLWSGTPCASTFYNEIQTTDAPIATFIATSQITGTRTVLETSAAPTQTINQGAKVVVVKLNTGSGAKPIARAALKKQISIGTVNSPVMTFADGTQMTLTDFFSNQIQASVAGSSFVLAEAQ